jgi:transcriptional regulator with XRE-family HTH domain
MPKSSRQLLRHISARVRHEREARELSQQRLAEMADVSRRMLAAIESEESNVSLATLDRIAAAMNLSFAELLRDPVSMPTVTQVEAWRGRSKQSRAVLLQSTPAARNVELWDWSLAPGERYRAEADRPGMREQVYVISGALTLKIDGQAKRLAAGESWMFESDRDYEYRNDGKAVVRFVKNVVE